MTNFKADRERLEKLLDERIEREQTPIRKGGVGYGKEVSDSFNKRDYQ